MSATNETEPSARQVSADIVIHVSPEAMFDVLFNLRSVIGPSNAHRMCVESSVLVDAYDNTLVVFHERWKDLAAFEKHVRSRLYRKVLAAIELADATPEIRIESVRSIGGLEVITALRSGAGEEPRDASEAGSETVPKPTMI